ncbi:HAT transposon superfamily [Quillaja saponaria]|uniref:HAT transposon superfamily n=1 Tax=Quillaja saponaria TaxID=32244 RepID=A0AAD7KS83_QUISA|nr:HAT transposon superfamily [Quillaja saponaria]
MVRGRDACWEHCALVDATRQKVRCNYCQREFSGGVYRMKFHLAQIKNKDIVPCTEVPTDVRDHIQNILSTPKKQKTPKKSKVDRAAAANGEQNSSSASGGFRTNHGSSGQNGSACPSLLYPHPSPSAPPIVDDSEKRKHDIADKKIAVFFFHNSIPFSAAKSMYYQEMVDAIAECGVGYKAPSYEKLRGTLLEKVKGDVHNCYKKYRDEWKETGCTILCDSWSDGRTNSLVVFSVTCPKGTLFLKSVDVSGHEDDTTYLFELLESVVIEVGVEHVVQVITDTTASYVYAGRLLMAKYSSLFWSPCASYCIDKILEDIGRQDWVGTVLEEANTITRYIYSHAWTLNMMRKFTGGMELIRPRMTRFVTNFLSLRSIVIQEDNLKHMFSHTEWLSSIYNRRPDAQATKSLLYLERFWKYAHEAVSVSEPLVKLLRIVDGDMPAMGYVYEGVDRAKAEIKAYYKGNEEKYTPIWDIIDRRWNMQLHSSLHAAAAFLNPSIFYNPNFKIDLRMRNGFQEAMLRMATTDKDKMEITKEHPVYINAQGALGTDFAVLGRTLNAPGDWWTGYGYEIPTLQKAAIRILSQPCSSHWCRFNWSTFESIHIKKRNRVELEKFNDLVFVHCNLWLQTICQSRDAKCKPVIFDELDVSSEWPTETESSIPLLDDSWLDNLPLESKGSP